MKNIKIREVKGQASSAGVRKIKTILVKKSKKYSLSKYKNMKKILNSKYSLEYICENWLDNANVNIHFSKKDLSFKLDFYIFGTVDDIFAYFTINVTNWLHISISKEYDDEQFKMILDCSIKKRHRNDFDKSVTSLAEINQKNQDYLWELSANSGEIEVKVITRDIEYEVFELTKEEYDVHFYGN